MTLALGVGAAALILIAPMLAIASLCSGVESGNAVGAGAAVGIGAIFRAVSRDILRTPIGSASRASAQAVARGWVHGSIRHVWQMRPAGFSLAVAFISLAISYGAVVAFARPELAGDRPFWAIGVLGAIPILVYRGLTWCFGRLWSVEITPRIHADGLLMQAYFTAALSFLPLAFDAEYRGRREHRSLAALSTLGSLLMIHLVLRAIAWSPEIEHLSTIFLIYAFVLSFPFRPLDGRQIWKASKPLWLVAWLAIGTAFHFHVPEVFYALL